MASVLMNKYETLTSFMEECKNQLSETDKIKVHIQFLIEISVVTIITTLILINKQNGYND